MLLCLGLVMTFLTYGKQLQFSSRSSQSVLGVLEDQVRWINTKHDFLAAQQVDLPHIGKSSDDDNDHVGHYGIIKQKDADHIIDMEPKLRRQLDTTGGTSIYDLLHKFKEEKPRLCPIGLARFC